MWRVIAEPWFSQRCFLLGGYSSKASILQPATEYFAEGVEVGSLRMWVAVEMPVDVLPQLGYAIANPLQLYALNMWVAHHAVVIVCERDRFLESIQFRFGYIQKNIYIYIKIKAIICIY